MRDFTLLQDSDPISRAVEVLLNGQENQFLVTDGIRVTGTVTRNDIIRGLTTQGEQAPIGKIAKPVVTWVRADQTIKDVRLRMIQRGITILPVGQDGILEGVIDIDNINEFLLIQQARKKDNA